MKNQDYWQSSLPSQELLSKISKGTRVIWGENGMGNVAHAAQGVGPFGKLTQLGLLQMVDVGSRIRDELCVDKWEDENELIHSNPTHQPYSQLSPLNGRLFTPNNPIHISKIKVYSTAFPRTLQSVQALLIGLFPDGMGSNMEIDIDTRYTDILIPDPQPRYTKKQEDLELVLSKRPHMQERERELSELQQKTTYALQDLLGSGANKVSFGIGEEGTSNLSWSQLAEITTCLKLRDGLPSSITDEDYHQIKSHVAWKWFESLRDDELAKLSMGRFVKMMLKTLVENGQNSMDEEYTESIDPLLYIYSGHDSSLIGFLCAFRLEQPAKWPEYGSYIKVELFERTRIQLDKGGINAHRSLEEKQYYVRFSLNGNVLKTSWGVGQDEYMEPSEMIPLRTLTLSIEQEFGT